MNSDSHISTLQRERTSFRARIISGHLLSGRYKLSHASADDCEANSSAITTAPAVEGSLQPLSDHDHDVVIVSALRTPICKSTKGGFKVCHR